VPQSEFSHDRPFTASAHFSPCLMATPPTRRTNVDIDLSTFDFGSNSTVSFHRLFACVRACMCVCVNTNLFVYYVSQALMRNVDNGDDRNEISNSRGRCADPRNATYLNTKGANLVAVPLLL
jgi:hypothetical protein